MPADMRDRTLGLAEIAVPIHASDLVAVSDGLGRVRILAAPSGVELAVFDTVLDPGGERLAVLQGPGVDLVAAGSWDRREVVAYRADSGREVWRRSGVGRVQRIAPAGKGGYLTIAFDTGPLLVLDGRSGRSVARINGARAYWQAAFSDMAVVATSDSLSIADSATWTRRGRYRLHSFAVLDVAMNSESRIVVSEPAEVRVRGSGHISCLTAELRLLWELTTPPGTHVPWLGYHSQQSVWVGVEVDLRGNGRTLVSWDVDGDWRSRVTVPISADYAFTADGAILVAAEGEMFDAVSGEQIATL